ncbi:MAG: glycosyltransferase [Woeseiaceae bacterium]|jgi:glycosyltransferase involved in cell wall biosynthesis
MHVVLVTTSYPESSSGSEAAGGFVADFAHQLAQHSKVTVIAATSGPASRLSEGSLQVHRFSVPRWPLSLLKPYRPSDWWPILRTLRDGKRTVDEVIRSERPDYIFALWALPSGHWARVMLDRYGIPYGVWALGSDIWSLGRIPILRWYLRNVLKRADRCFADGLELAAQVTEIGGASCDFMPSARLLPKTCARDLATSGPWRLAFLGRWHVNKGIDIFLKSLRALTSDDWEQIAEVRIHGGGPLENEVRSLVTELRECGHPVSVGGYLDKERATELICWTDYLTLPSRIESIPVILSDAAQLGRPLIATPVGDLPRLFANHQFGIIAEAATVAAYTLALQRALRTSPAQFRSGLSALADEFDIRRVADGFARYVEDIGCNESAS